MKNYIKTDAWAIIEEGFHPQWNKVSESIFSLGNGRMGQRANFEENYSGQSLQGNYVAGIYYPDKTRVGWWKNGYPDYFAKVLNAANWIGMDIRIDGESLDLAQAKVLEFKRILHMKAGYLERTFRAELSNGRQIDVCARRFCSIANDELGAIHYKLKALNFSATIDICAYIDGDVSNQDSNYDEKFWDFVADKEQDAAVYLTLKTKKTAFEVCTGSHIAMRKNGKLLDVQAETQRKSKYIGQMLQCYLQAGDEVEWIKTAVVLSSENHEKTSLQPKAAVLLKWAVAQGFENLLAAQTAAWARKWEESDILIEGDIAAQQAIRFNIFQLFQTYTGRDDRLNIGPKGFTGEKYGGSTYWDTEAYCVPFYLATAPQQVSKNLLIYRYRQLGKAIENAQKLGFKDGAALYPMVTINGEECHNEWEITFEEIHRNGAVAYAIYNYVRYTGDESYLADYGFEVLCGIARFWKQRVNWSAEKSKYVILGVTGPNEYENNINNNWYTNYLAVWCLKYTREVGAMLAARQPERYRELQQKLGLKEQEYIDWQAIEAEMYFPYYAAEDVFLQQDGYLDKEQMMVAALPEQERPLNQHWSWDRILRSCFIKQADVLQGLYFFEDDFDLKTHQRNFDFYEARTVHESSLSPCVHSILAAKLGDTERAYRFYLRTSRLDLNDYNNDTEDGLHITSMAGTWMSVVEGFAGMRVREHRLCFRPLLPENWQTLSFNMLFRGAQLRVEIRATHIHIQNYSAQTVDLLIGEKAFTLGGFETFRQDLSLRPASPTDQSILMPDL